MPQPLHHIPQVVRHIFMNQTSGRCQHLIDLMILSYFHYISFKFDTNAFCLFSSTGALQDFTNKVNLILDDQEKTQIKVNLYSNS